ncbi:MAG: caspase family protein [Elusimicrobiota bacterium]
MNLLLAFFLAVAEPAAAAPKPLALQKISEFPVWGGLVSRDFKIYVSADDRTVNAWRISDGRQLAAARLPPIEKTGGDAEYIGYTTLDISPDDRSVVVGVVHVSGLKADLFAYRVSLADEKAKLLLSRTGLGCRQGVYRSCPEFTRASFSPDDKRLAVWSWDYQSAVPGMVYHLDVVDADGKSLLTRAETAKPAENENYWSADDPAAGVQTGGFDSEGRLLGLIERKAGCEVWDVDAGKRVSFLEDCRIGESPWFLTPRLVAGTFIGDREHSETRSYDLWDAATGRKIYRGPWTYDLFSAPTPDGGLLFKFDKAAKSIEVIDTAKGVPVAVSTNPVEFNGVPLMTHEMTRSLPVSPNADIVLLLWGNSSIRAYRTGLFAKTPAVAVQPVPPPVPQAAPVPELDVDSPPATNAKPDPDAFAVVIGIEKYRQEGIPAVDFAERDARTMYSYLTGAMGYDSRNVVLLTNEHASKADLEKNLGSWLKNRVGSKSRVFVYYAGHGSPNPETGQGYLMPYEADPAYLADTAFPLSKLYSSLGKLPTKDVTVVLDACFSGQGQRSLIAKGTRPLVSVVQSRAAENTVVLAAAGSNQVSASNPDARHGLLTYYLLAGLHGEADARHDGRITSEELIAYVRPAVERAAKLQNVEQTPSLASPPNAPARPWIVLTPQK